MTRDEKVFNNIEVVLDEGEFIQNKKIIKVPKPQDNSKYLNWDKEKHQQKANLKSLYLRNNKI